MKPGLLLRIGIVLCLAVLNASCKKDHRVVASGSGGPYATVYIAGTSFDTAMFWQNGKSTALPSQPGQAGATSLFIKGGDIYVCGNVTQNGYEKAVYWKNGTINFMPGVDATLPSFANAIFVSGSD